MSTGTPNIGDGGPAFPVGVAAFPNANGEAVIYDSQDRCGGGMTLRDWFAGKAMAEMSLVFLDIDTHCRIKGRPWVTRIAEQVDRSAERCEMESFDYMADTAYEMADAMLRARKVGA